MTGFFTHFSFRERKRSLLLLLIGAAFWTYALLRTFALSLTWDEAYSYLVFVRTDTFVLERYEWMSANHHLLNSWLMWLSTQLFGNAEWALRLPNLLACAVYVFFALRLVMQFRHFFTALFGLCILLLNPFAADFFSLARGYGLAMAAAMAAIFYLCRFTDIKATRKVASAGIGCAALSVCANFSFLNFFLAYAAALGLAVLLAKKEKREKLKLLVPVIVTTAATSALLFPILLQLKDAGALFLGTHEGIWKGSVRSLLEAFAYKRSHAELLVTALRVLIFGGGALALLAAFRWVRGKFSPGQLAPVLLLFLLLSGWGLTELQHAMFATPYAQDRAALWLFVTFAALLALTLDRLLVSWPAAVALLPGAAGLLLHFGACMNLRSTYTWAQDSDAKALIGWIVQHKGELLRGRDSLMLGVNEFASPAYNYYRLRHRAAWLSIVQRKDGAAPELLDANVVLDGHPDLQHAPGWRKAATFPDAKTALWKRDDTIVSRTLYAATKEKLFAGSPAEAPEELFAVETAGTWLVPDSLAGQDGIEALLRAESEEQLPWSFVFCVEYWRKGEQYKAVWNEPVDRLYAPGEGPVWMSLFPKAQARDSLVFELWYTGKNPRTVQRSELQIRRRKRAG